MIGAVWELITFTSMVKRLINTSRNERVTLHLYPFSVHVVTFNFITNLMHLFNYHNSHLKHHTLKMSVMHN